MHTGKYIGNPEEPLILPKRSYLVAKRLFDMAFSLAGITLLVPVYIAIAVLIVSIDGPPILFKQTRTGRCSIPFQIWKFKTMRPAQQGKEASSRKYDWTDGVPDDFMFKSASSGYPITRLGGILRRYSLDELPQLYNVLTGCMSIVGPRPEIPEITCHYNAVQKQRLLVKPGMTGWAQVNGRSALNQGEKLKYDLHYIRNSSILFDLKIVAMTAIKLLTGKGAY